MMQINGTLQTEFKETEIGLIPVDWEVIPLEEVARTSSGGTPSRKKPEYFGGDIFWVKSGELNDTVIEFTDETITELGLKNSSAKIFSKGTLLIALYGATVGKTGLLAVDATTNQAVCAVFPEDCLMPNFMMHQFIARRDELLKERYGGAQPNISQQTVRSFKAVIPPLPEQRRIATVLNTIQDEIAVQDDILRELREFKRSTMERLFTYGAGDIPAETKITEIGEIPVHWEVVELDEVADIDYGIQAAVAHMTDESIGIPILTNVNIDLEGYLDLSLLRYYPLPNKKSDKILKHGDVLFNWRSGSEKHVGKTAIFDLDDEYTFSSFILRFRIKKSVQTHFLVYFLQYQKDMGFFTKKSGQSSVNSVINASNAAKLPVAFPEYTQEQDRIVSILSDIDAKIGAEEDRKSALQDFFRTMLQQLMTGQIRLLSDEGLPE